MPDSNVRWLVNQRTPLPIFLQIIGKNRTFN